MEISIAGQVFTIKLESGRAMKDLYGDCDYQKKTIRLKKTMDVEDRRQTLSHEVFHAFLGVTGYKELLHGLNEELEEALTVAFEGALGNYLYYSDEIEEWIQGGKHSE